MGKRGKKRAFGEGVSKKGQKKLRQRSQAISKAREILGTGEDADQETEEELAQVGVVS